MRKTLIHSMLLIGVVIMMGCKSSSPVQRYASVIGVKTEALDKYKALHANPWPELNAKLKQVNIQNYSIYLTQFPDGNHYLFGYFEYTGKDFAADMKRMGDDPKTKEWWSHTDPMQIPLSNKKDDEWWKNMEEVFQQD